MGKTSSKVKDRYNAKAYDEIKIRVYKGEKEKIKSHAESNGESINGFVKRSIDETMERDKANKTEQFRGRQVLKYRLAFSLS